MAYHCQNCGTSVSNDRTYVPFFDLGACADCFHIKKKVPMNNNQPPIEFIQLGGLYETHDHSKVQCVYIYANHGQAVYIFPDNPEAEPMTSDYRGKTYCGEGRIIGQWKEKPVVDWSLYSIWFKYIGFNDYDSSWSLYVTEPKYVKNLWIGGTSEERIPKGYGPKYIGRGKDSLCERPE